LRGLSATAEFFVMSSPPYGEGAISVAFVRLYVRLSVCTSVAYIANNSITEWPSGLQRNRAMLHVSQLLASIVDYVERILVLLVT